MCLSWHDEVNGEGGGTAAAAHVPLHRLNKTTQNNTKTPTHSHVCTVHPTGGDSLVLAELSEFMEAVGEADPMAKIYVTTKKLDNLATYAFFTTLAQVCAFVRACVCVRVRARVPSSPPLSKALQEPNTPPCCSPYSVDIAAGPPDVQPLHRIARRKETRASPVLMQSHLAVAAAAVGGGGGGGCGR